MIIFHEGLPRSGKSYEAIVQIIEWLKEGKKVVTNIAGLNYEHISKLVGMPEPVLKKLLVQISNDDVAKIWEVIPLPDHETGAGEKDLHIVIDELQDFFPVSREKPPKELSTWVASHGHAGWHILAMGQDLRDCHNIWKRRVQRKVVFTKQTALGRENHYKWELFEATQPEKFRSIGSGTKPYDKKIFGSYQSHVEGTTQTGAVMDDRGIIWKRPTFRYGAPIAIIVAIYSVNHLFSFFSYDEEVLVQTAKPSQVKTSAPARPVTPVRKPAVVKKAESEKPPPIDYVDQMAEKYRMRLSGIIQSSDKVIANIDAMDSTFHLKERFSIEDLEGMGWTVEVKAFGLVISKRASGRYVSHVVRQWPIDPFGRSSRQTRTDSRMRTGT